MKIQLKEITVEKLTDGFADNAEQGNGHLDLEEIEYPTGARLKPTLENVCNYAHHAGSPLSLCVDPYDFFDRPIM